MVLARYGLSDVEKVVEIFSAKARVSIIKALSSGPQPSSSIFDQLKGEGFDGMERSTFYYHMSRLKSEGIVEEIGQVPGAGKPEKLWALAVDSITIDLRKQ